MKVGDIITIERYDDGIIMEDQFIYLGDGIYAPIRPDHKPEIECGEEGENSNGDIYIQEGTEEDGEGNQDQYDSTERVYTI